MLKKSKYYWFILVISLVVNACTTSSPASVNTTTVADASGTSLPTPITSLTPTQVSTLIPTATPTLHPLQIEAMRAWAYPGSDIVIEKILDPGVNYSRYYVSYLSEGLKIYALMTVPNGDKPSTGWPVIVFNHGYIPPNVY